MMRTMDKNEIIKKIQKVVWDWKELHSEISEVLNALDPKSDEYKVVMEIARVENQLVEQAQDQLWPLFQKLKEILLRK